MSKKFRAPWRAFVVVALVAAGVAALAATTGHRAAAAHVMTPATMQAPTHIVAATALQQPDATVRFTCQLPLTDPRHPAGINCYGPDQIRAAYSIQSLLDQHFDGTGQTIAIIDAYGSPTLQADMNLFNAVWHLPAKTVHVDTPFGVAATTPRNAAGWAQETSLDVQWAHAVAPGANIELVVSKSNNDSDILDATQWAVDNNVGDVISQSFGEAEQCMDSSQLPRQHQIFDAAVAKGITLFASSGDQGAGQPACDATAHDEYIKAASTPASDPDVTAVGGTDLNADPPTGAYHSESTWNESATFGDAVSGGGGVSTLFKRPDYQAPFVKDTHAREVPDVSYNAAVFDGVIVIYSGGAFLFGGTSSGSPQWAGLTAITDQIAGGRVGAINKTLYKLAKMPNASSYFHDVADGSNNSVPNFLASDPPSDTSNGTPDGTVDGFTAVSGYDMATGLGSPIASNLLPAIAKPGQG